MPRFWHILVTPISGRARFRKYDIISRDYGPKREGAVNSQRLVRDFRAIVGESRPIRHQSGRPPFWALIAAKNASILTHFSRPDIGPEMDPELGYHPPRLWPGEWAARIGGGLAAISQRSSGNRGQISGDRRLPLYGP